MGGNGKRALRKKAGLPRWAKKSGGQKRPLHDAKSRWVWEAGLPRIKSIAPSQVRLRRRGGEAEYRNASRQHLSSEKRRVKTEEGEDEDQTLRG